MADTLLNEEVKATLSFVKAAMEKKNRLGFARVRCEECGHTLTQLSWISTLTK